MTKEEIIEFWSKSSDKDYKVMDTLFNIKARYPDYKIRFKKKATKGFTVSVSGTMPIVN
jgi:hypothetical protein